MSKTAGFLESVPRVDCTRSRHVSCQLLWQVKYLQLLQGAHEEPLFRSHLDLWAKILRLLLVVRAGGSHSHFARC